MIAEATTYADAAFVVALAALFWAIGTWMPWS